MSTNYSSESSSPSDIGPRPRCIKILVGYEWAKDVTKVVDRRLVSPRVDPRWQFIKGKLLSVTKAVETMASKRSPSTNQLDIRIERLRGSHGQMLLDNLRGRIEAADILVMDIGSADGKSFNSNVLLETGMAVAYGFAALRKPFILKPAGVHAPSDLKGFLFTDYEPANRGDGVIRLLDDAGFRAAVRSTIVSIAFEREMIGQRRQPGTDIEGEGDEDPDMPPPPSEVSSPEARQAKEKAKGKATKTNARLR